MSWLRWYWIFRDRSLPLMSIWIYRLYESIWPEDLIIFHTFQKLKVLKNFPHVWPARLHSGTHLLSYIMACGWALDRLSQGDRTQVETLERWHLRAQGVWLPGVPWSLTVDQPLKECTHAPEWLECPVNESCALDVTMPTYERTGKN